MVSDKELKVDLIDHKFMVSGHSYLPNDRDFGLIKQYAKNRTKFGPNEYGIIL